MFEAVSSRLIRFRPQVIIVLGVDELHIDANTIARSLDSTLENIADAERRRDFGNAQ